MTEHRFRLRSSEWLLTGSLFLLLLSLVAISKIKASQAGPPIENVAISFDVVIDGHVKKPGVYQVVRGTQIGEILKKASPLKFADLRAISLNAPITHPMELRIECLKELSIRVEGAVQNPGIIRVPPGTRISDLKKLLSAKEGADLTYFKKKRLVQDGEIINIPSRDR